MDSLTLLSEEDLKGMSMPLGPRRKILRALEERKNALNNERLTPEDTKF